MPGEESGKMLDGGLTLKHAERRARWLSSSITVTTSSIDSLCHLLASVDLGPPGEYGLYHPTGSTQTGLATLSLDHLCARLTRLCHSISRLMESYQRLTRTLVLELRGSDSSSIHLYRPYRYLASDRIPTKMDP